jgi:hypothetical protein
VYIPIHSTRKLKVFFRINGLVNLGWTRGSVESCKKTRKIPLQRPSFGGYMRVCLGYPNPHGLEVSYSGTTRNQSSLFFNMWYAISMRTPQESSRKLPFCFLVLWCPFLWISVLVFVWGCTSPNGTIHEICCGPASASPCRLARYSGDSCLFYSTA